MAGLPAFRSPRTPARYSSAGRIDRLPLPSSSRTGLRIQRFPYRKPNASNVMHPTERGWIPIPGGLRPLVPAFRTKSFCMGPALWSHLMWVPLPSAADAIASDTPPKCVTARPDVRSAAHLTTTSRRAPLPQSASIMEAPTTQPSEPSWLLLAFAPTLALKWRAFPSPWQRETYPSSPYTHLKPFEHQTHPGPPWPPPLHFGQCFVVILTPITRIGSGMRVLTAGDDK